MKNVLSSLTKNVLIALGLAATALAASVGTDKKVFWNLWFRKNSTYKISNEETKDIMKIAKSLKVFSLLVKSVTQTFKNKEKEQRNEFLGMLLGTLGVNLFGNILADNSMIWGCNGVRRAVYCILFFN